MDYKKHYDLLVTRAQKRSLGSEIYIERHHINPKCMGGSDDLMNIVELTPEEHYIAHLLLVKIYPQNRGLVWAAVMMTCHNSENRANNKLYGWLRRKSQKIAKSRTGYRNGSFQTVWINKIGTTENKKISIHEDIPDGWRKGRKLKFKEERFCVCGNTLSVRATICSQCSTRKNVPEPKRKLTKADVLSIKEQLRNNVSRATIAENFNVSKWAVIDIDLKRTWKDI